MESKNLLEFAFNPEFRTIPDLCIVCVYSGLKLEFDNSSIGSAENLYKKTDEISSTSKLKLAQRTLFEQVFSIGLTVYDGFGVRWPYSTDSRLPMLDLQISYK